MSFWEVNYPFKRLKRNVLTPAEGTPAAQLRRLSKVTVSLQLSLVAVMMSAGVCLSGAPHLS